LYDSNPRWIIYAVLSGLALGIGNYIIGIKLAQEGIFSSSFSGPFPLALLLIYRFMQMIRNFFVYRSPINLGKSNWFYRIRNRRVMFKRKNILPLTGSFLPTFLAFITTNLSFTYCALGGLNQGIISTLIAFAGVFTVIIFYFRFHEPISFIQIVGMAVMILSVVLLGLEGASKGEAVHPIGPDVGENFSFQLGQEEAKS
jgi:drug/metabolite transporter (DMT)-like permease